MTQDEEEATRIALRESIGPQQPKEIDQRFSETNKRRRGAEKEIENPLHVTSALHERSSRRHAASSLNHCSKVRVIKMLCIECR